MTLEQVPRTANYQNWKYAEDPARPARQRWEARRGHFDVTILTASTERGIRKAVDDYNEKEDA